MLLRVTCGAVALALAFVCCGDDGSSGGRIDGGAGDFDAAPEDGGTGDGGLDAAPLCTAEACDDGLFCNGNETCNPASGCVPGADRCTDICSNSCAEASDQCIPETFSITWAVDNAAAQVASGTDDMTCADSVIVHEHTASGGCPMKYVCAIDAQGKLSAYSYSDELLCLGFAGPGVTAGCSVSDGQPGSGIYEVVCCFP